MSSESGTSIKVFSITQYREKVFMHVSREGTQRSSTYQNRISFGSARAIISGMMALNIGHVPKVRHRAYKLVEVLKTPTVSKTHMLLGPGIKPITDLGLLVFEWMDHNLRTVPSSGCRNN
jgi:hypothetical protein